MLTAVQVYTSSKRFLDAYAAVMRPLSEAVNMAQTAVDILLFLANNPGLDTAKDICTYRQLKPGIVSFHVEKLVQKGYLARRAVPGDRRKSRLICTEKAAPVIEQGRVLQNRFTERMIAGLEPAELETCLHCFTVFEQNLIEMAETAVLSISTRPESSETERRKSK